MLKTCDEKPPLSEAIELVWRLLRDIGADLRDLYTMKSRSLAEGFAFLTKTLPQLGKAFDRGLGDSAFKLPSAFKKWRKATEIPAFLGSLFRSVFHDDGTLRADANHQSVASIRQVCFIFYKYELQPDPKEVDKRFSAWIETDSQLPVEFPVEDPVLEAASRTAEKIFGSFNPLECTFRHGPGAVSDAARPEKYLCTPAPFDGCIRHFGLHTYLASFEADLLMTEVAIVFTVAWALELPYEEVLPQVFSRSPLTSRLIAVPKDSRGPRLINMEPVLHQWYQQGIMKWTVDRLETHHLTAGAINFTNQEVNRSLAISASEKLDLATVDLKDASDRVSYALVKRVFSRCPEYFAALDVTRTKCAEVRLSDGTSSYVDLKKWAAMGSATCFTTLAFTVYVLIFSELTINSGWTPIMVNSLVKVYGDDIVIPKVAFERVRGVLEKYGLIVNADKSFIGSPFAESCGMDAFRGSKVTPVRARALLSRSIQSSGRKLKCIKDPAKAEIVMKTAKLAVQMQVRGYSLSSEYLYSLVESYLGRPLPYGTMEASYICRVVNPWEATFLNRAHNLSRWIARQRQYSRDDRRDGPSIGPDPLDSLWIDRRETVFGYRVVSRTTQFDETAGTRIRRVLPLMGLGSVNGARLPEWGSIPDRGFELKGSFTEVSTQSQRGEFTVKPWLEWFENH